MLAEGGSGEYIWSSRDTTVVSVTKDGVVTGRTAGREVVLASDAKNADNSGSAEVTCVWVIVCLWGGGGGGPMAKWRI